MSKLKADEIVGNDVEEFLASTSDFAFEMEVLKYLQDNKFKYEHSATYADPVTGKPRQFDIRARLRRYDSFRPDMPFFFFLAVECKNLRPNFPLLVSCVPRTRNEAYHEVIASFDPSDWPRNSRVSPDQRVHSRRLRLDTVNSARHDGDPVGKNCAQIGRADSKASEIVASDAEFYDKWAQCIASGADLVDSAHNQNGVRKGTTHFTAVLPLVVVPDDRLWIAKYGADGSLLGTAVRANEVSYFVGHEYLTSRGEVHYVVSHVDIVTVAGLKSLVNCLTDGPALEQWFSDGALEDLFESERGI